MSAKKDLGAMPNRVISVAPWICGRDGDAVYLNATAVAFDQKGVVILGRSGAGKSRLALSIMALGGRLIADDGLWVDPGGVLRRPDAAPPWIEARGFGLLPADPIRDPMRASLVVDLDTPALARLPEPEAMDLCGRPVALLRAGDWPDCAPVVVQILRFGPPVLPDQTSP